MAGVDLGSGGAKKKGKQHKSKKRLNVRIDMTPMVDVVMLLITFFMLTTVFNTPQTMEINIPPDESKVEVAETSLLTLRVLADGSIYWNMGIENPQTVAFKELRPLLAGKLRDNPKLITLVKVEREGTFEMMVNVMDEINLANITRFSLAPFGDIDKKVIQKGIGA
jgi:biopolymer transport protein ExbD